VRAVLFEVDVRKPPEPAEEEVTMKLLLPIIFIASAATIRAEEPVQFRSDVIASLSRAGCNGGACHGSPQGKNGFRLSLRGFDADLDYNNLVKEQGGRRINRQSPTESLILQKGSGQMPHGGGVLFNAKDEAYRTIARWIAEGSADSPPPMLTRLEVNADGDATSATRKLTAKAHFADGSSKDVTALAVFTSSDAATVPVTPNGAVRFTGTAEATVLARYPR